MFDVNNGHVIAQHDTNMKSSDSLYWNDNIINTIIQIN
jgi:hypothetical protein